MLPFLKATFIITFQIITHAAQHIYYADPNEGFLVAGILGIYTYVLLTQTIIPDKLNKSYKPLIIAPGMLTLTYDLTNVLLGIHNPGTPYFMIFGFATCCYYSLIMKLFK